MLTKAQLLKIVKRIPDDAKEIRFGRLWTKEIGDFEYVSFEYPKYVEGWDTSGPAKAGSFKLIHRVPTGTKNFNKT